jgi:hypothetical protein
MELRAGECAFPLMLFFSASFSRSFQKIIVRQPFCEAFNPVGVALEVDWPNNSTGGEAALLVKGKQKTVPAVRL